MSLAFMNVCLAIVFLLIVTLIADICAAGSRSSHSAGDI